MPVVGPTAPGDELLTLMAAMLACVHGLGMLAFRCCAAAELLYVLGHRNPRSLPLKKSAHYILLLHHDDDVMLVVVVWWCVLLCCSYSIIVVLMNDDAV